jgi:OOP family OmpA-OmpF porin
MNQQLSQARAQSVLNELRSRRILTTNFVAKGYGESQPIADNSTEEGREANRRIEFRLTRVETSGEEDENGLDTAADLAQQEASADEPAEDTAAGETVSDEAQEAATEASEPTEEGSTDEQN